MLIFKAILPPPGAADVVSREFTLTLPDQEPVVISLAADALEVPDLRAPQDTVITLSLVDVDDGGNRSEARELSTTLIDTIPPPQPGELGIVITGEE
jgi:hypothetical protein